MAEPGATYDGAQAFSGGVLGELEKGCYTPIVMPALGENGEDCMETVGRNSFFWGPVMRRVVDLASQMMCEVFC